MTGRNSDTGNYRSDQPIKHSRTYNIDSYNVSHGLVHVHVYVYDYIPLAYQI